ncbi:MAG: hypothetical protein L0H53_07455, partial [Candidatus Nitrosocosmicus sp.]|nr:hypothetical protein [Candidatus Nitrosocosmicus sp.]
MKFWHIMISCIILNLIFIIFLFWFSGGSIKTAEIVNASLNNHNENLESKNEFINTSANDAILMINTTSFSNCISDLPIGYQKFNNSNNNLAFLQNTTFTAKNVTFNELDNSSRDVLHDGDDNSIGICKIFDISDSITCLKYIASNDSRIPCELFGDQQEREDNSLEIEIDRENFGKKGYLVANTKFDNQYSFEIKDPLNQKKKFRVNLDFNEHSQSENEDINSPRLEIVRMNENGLPDMTAAKNQEIIWTGNIKGYFEEPENGNDFANETYIAIQFNTGRHGSNEPNEERAFGVLFDVSASSNPYLFEYRDDGKYVKYDYDTIKQLAGEGFIFHHRDKEGGGPLFIDNLTNTENVKLKVMTFLIKNNTRTIETFIGNSSTGIEIPYWTLNNLSKLKEHEGI